jgi:hypothetical protein
VDAGTPFDPRRDEGIKRINLFTMALELVATVPMILVISSISTLVGYLTHLQTRPDFDDLLSYSA